MATPSTSQYNLHSSSQETVQLPVELHMSEDSTFLRNLLAIQKASIFGQVSDNESSLNESDCEAIVASSDEETSCKCVVDKKSDKHSDPTVLGTSEISQQTINMQILSQLQVLGKRLEAVEQKSCKKSTDVSKIKTKSTKPKSVSQAVVAHTPSHPYSFTDLPSLQQDVELQAQVEKRLQELTALNKTGTKVRSLRGGSADVLVPNRVKWPHEYILSGSAKELPLICNTMGGWVWPHHEGGDKFKN